MVFLSQPFLCRSRLVSGQLFSPIADELTGIIMGFSTTVSMNLVCIFEYSGPNSKQLLSGHVRWLGNPESACHSVEMGSRTCPGHLCWCSRMDFVGSPGNYVHRRIDLFTTGCL